MFYLLNCLILFMLIIGTSKVNLIMSLARLLTRKWLLYRNDIEYFLCVCFFFFIMICFFLNLQYLVIIFQTVIPYVSLSFLHLKLIYFLKVNAKVVCSVIILYRKLAPQMLSMNIVHVIAPTAASEQSTIRCYGLYHIVLHVRNCSR